MREITETEGKESQIKRETEREKRARKRWKRDFLRKEEETEKSLRKVEFEYSKL